jgi:hypothetical protein
LFELKYDLWNDRQLCVAKQTADMVLNLSIGLSADVNCMNLFEKRGPTLVIADVIVKGNIKLLRVDGYG